MWIFLSKCSDSSLAELFHLHLGVIMCLLATDQHFLMANAVVTKLSVDTVIRRARCKSHSVVLIKKKVSRTH